MELIDELVDLYRKVATDLSEDIVRSLESAKKREAPGTPACKAMDIILENIRLAKKEGKPICQDTGMPIFYVRVGKGISHKEISDAIVKATKRATDEVPLRQNFVDPLTGKVAGNSPIIHFEEWDKDYTLIDLLLKGGGCENVGRSYHLPDDDLGAERDVEGIKKCIIDAVFRAQGKSCPPEMVGVGIGGTRSSASLLSQRQLMRKVSDRNPDKELSAMEKELLKKLNESGIGPLGLGGKTTVLGVKIGKAGRHPASFFVDVSFCCWACRRGSLKWKSR